MTRAEHMAWAKQRALAYCDTDDPHNAFASLLQDLDKHPETQNHLGIGLAMRLVLAGQLTTVAEKGRGV